MFKSLKRTVQEIVNPAIEQPVPLKPIYTARDVFNNEIKRLCSSHLNNGYKLQSLYTYKTLEGKVIYWRIRLQNDKGEKIIRPIRKENDSYIMLEPKFQGKKPLFNQEQLQLSDDPVFVVEGENKVLALSKIGITAVTSGGSTSASGADWTPLKGRKVVIWPDRDQPGKDFAKNSADILLQLDCDVVLVDVDKLNLSESEDVVDWLKQNPNATKQDIMALGVEEYNVEETTPANEANIPEILGEWDKPVLTIQSRQSSPYPVDALPKGILEPVQEVVDFTQCPFAIAACSALANISLATQGLVDVERTPGLDSPSSLYFLIIAESGERKTSVDNKFSKAIRQWEKEMKVDYDLKLKKYSADNDVWETKEEIILNAVKATSKKGQNTQALENQLINHRALKPIEPRLKSLIYTDATSEALAYDLYTNYRYGGVFTSEGGSVFGGSGMRKESAMSYLTLLNILWDGSSYKVDRKTSQSFMVEDARLAICIAIQRNTLNAFLTSGGKLARDTGFLARFLLTNPDSTQGTRMFKEAPKDWPALENFNSRIRELLELLNTDDPRVMLHLSESAHKLWIEFHDSVEKQLGEDGDLTVIRDVASKAADNCARLAALFHVFEKGTDGEISFDHLKRASQIIEWHLHESKAFLSDAKKAAEGEDADSLKNWLIKECRKSGANAVRYSSILQSGPNHLRNKDALMKVIEELSEANILKLSDSDGTKYIDLNPAVLVTEAINDAHY